MHVVDPDFLLRTHSRLQNFGTEAWLLLLFSMSSIVSLR
jgi:hypothetical protein